MRVKILSESAAFLLPFAKKKLRQLEEMRLRTNQPLSQKILSFSAYKITLQTSPYEQSIILEGGSILPQMILSGGGGTYVYDYESNQAKKITATINGQIFPAGDKKFFQALADWFYRITKKGKHSQVRQLQQSFDVGGLQYQYGISIVWIGDTLYVLNPFTNRFLARVTVASSGWLGHKEVTGDGLISQPTSHILYSGRLRLPPQSDPESGTSVIPWNHMYTAEFDIAAIDPQYESFSNAWRWTPRLWNPSIGNDLGLYQGMYYGSTKGGGLWGPNEKINVRFGGMLDNRGGSQPFGYSEILMSYTEKDGPSTQTQEIFFIRELWEAPRSFFYDESRGRIWFQNDYWASAPQHAFRINPGFDNYGGSGATIDWWSTKDIPAQSFDGLPRPHEGIVVFHPTTGEWALYRYANYILKINSGRGYIEHSKSLNGEEVSIVYKDQETEAQKVFVYNFVKKENKDDPGTGDGMVIADKAMPSTLGVLERAQLIPYDDRKDPYSGLDPWFNAGNLYPQSVAPTKYRDNNYAASMFGMQHPWPPGNGWYVSGWKVNIVGGIVAQGMKWEDECWQNAEYTMYHDEEGEYDVFESTKMIYAGGPNGRHGTAGSLGNQVQVGIPKSGGSSPAGGGIIVKRWPISFGTEMLFGCLEPSRNAKPFEPPDDPYKWTGDVEEFGLFGSDGGCWKPVPGCKDDDDGNPIGEVDLEDACGEEAEGTWTFDKLEVHGSWEPEIGDSYSASGGKGPYQITTSGGLYLNSDDEVTGFGDCGGPGEKRTATVTATDSCGRTADMEVRLPGGSWVLTSQGDCDRAWYTGHVDLTFISGSTKEVREYHSSGCECFDDQKFLSPAGTCWGFNDYTCSGSGLGYYETGYTLYDGIDACKPETAPAGLETLGYDGRVNYGYQGDVPMGTCRSNAGNNYEHYGFRLWSASSDCYRYYEWQCP